MKKIIIATAVSLILTSTIINAEEILVTEMPWGQSGVVTNMTDVFSTFTTYNSYASAMPSSIFNNSNSFVFLEGGAGTDSNLQSYLTSNTTDILAWVNGGGALMIESAGWTSSINFNGDTLNLNMFNSTGNLTTDGNSAFNYFPVGGTYSGSYLAHDTITGSGLTTFMLGNDNGGAIIAGKQVGSGYIMYSGLTDIGFTNARNVIDNAIAYTAAKGHPVPEPTDLALIAIGLAGARLYRKKTQSFIPVMA